MCDKNLLWQIKALLPEDRNKMKTVAQLGLFLADKEASVILAEQE